MPRVMVIANNLLARTGLAALLGTHTDIDVVGQVAATESLSDDLDIYLPDVVVFDLGYEPTDTLPQLIPLAEAELPTIVLLPDDEHFSASLTALLDIPAYGVLLNESSVELLGEAITGVYGGLVVIDPLLAANLIKSQPNTSEDFYLLEDLTPRENEVLQQIARGLTNKAIAQKLEISPNTVKFHVNAILSKLDAQSRTEAVVRATQLGLIMI